MFNWFNLTSVSESAINSYSRDSEMPDMGPILNHKTERFALPTEVIRTHCAVKLYRDAHSTDDTNTCYSDMYNAIKNATQVIYITGWSLDVNTKMVPTDKDSKTLGELLAEKAKQGVHVYVLLWKVKGFQDLVGTRNYATKKFFKKNGIKYALWLSDTNRFIYTMHQKFVICDDGKSYIAFVGGLDITFGRYDTPSHPLFREYEHDKQNATKSDVLSDPLAPRQPWHDIHCQVQGPVIYDLMNHFCVRWKSVKGEEPRRGNNIVFETDTQLGEWNTQMYLSYKDAQMNHCHRSIAQAYVNAISKAKRYIYIESQYLIGGSAAWSESITTLGEAFGHKKEVAPNPIPIYIANRIIRAIEADEPFRAYIIIPFHPEGSQYPEHDFSVSKIMHLQYLTIQMMYKVIGKALTDNKRQGKPTDYLFVGCLGKVERIPIFDIMAKNMVYVHSKAMLVDDEYIILGSANLNERSLSGQRDGEICIGAWETDGGDRVRHCRRELFREHFGDRICMMEPGSIECMQAIKVLADENRIRFKATKVFKDNTHIMAHAFTVDDDGKVVAEQLDDLDGYRMSFSGYISKWVFDDFLCA